MINTFGNHSVGILLRIAIRVSKDPIVSPHRQRADETGRNNHFDSFIQCADVGCLNSAAAGTCNRNAIGVYIRTCQQIIYGTIPSQVCQRIKFAPAR